MANALSTTAREDRLLGACYAIGEDFGFNPLYLRILFAFGILSSPALAFTAYAALTAIVTLSRWMVPNPPRSARLEPASGPDEAPADFQEEFALAA